MSPSALTARYTGLLISNEEVERRYKGKYFFEVNTTWSIETPRSNTARYINHLVKVAIESGEELTYDYGKEYFDAHLKPRGRRCIKCAED